MSVPEHVARENGGHFERYLRCFRCSAPSSTFVPAVESDAPLGFMLQPCIVALVADANEVVEDFDPPIAVITAERVDL